MPHNTDLIDIVAVGLVTAFVLGALANRLRLSPLVGYLVAGIVVGPFTPGFVADQDLANQLAEIGVMLLMFGVGLHFSVKDLMDVKSIAIPGALAQITVATVLGWVLAWAMGWPMVSGFVFGLALSVASTVVLLRAMEERRLLDTRRGKIAVGWLIVEDLVMVLALVLLPVLAQIYVARAGETAPGAGAIVLTILWTLLKVSAFVAVMLLVGRRVIPWVLERIAGTGQRELFTLSVLAIALGVAFGASVLFGVSFALGAFFAGVVLNESEFSHEAANDSLPLRDAFAVLFFVSVGMLFNPMILVEHPWQVLATFLIIVVGKSIAAYWIVRLFKHPRSTALTISMSLAQIGEFSFILVGLGVVLGLLGETARDLVLAGSLLSIIVNPLLFAWLDRWQARQERAAREAAPAYVAPPEHVVPDTLAGHAILVGYGRVGRQLAELLRDRGVPLVLVEDDNELVRRARERGFLVVRGNIASEPVMLDTAPARAALAIFAIPQALEAGEAIERMKAINPVLTVLARAHSDGEVRHLLEHGADATVLAERELAYSLAEMVMSTPPFRPARGDTSPPAAAQPV
ncbi:YbaL family putative K(+) efflux transporter [Luteimonas deserti]|uniref:Kef family K(+) transporter n=1 Tax=Luteimonas deserti TaxID=2752306 RepID=A0A7Z0TZL3_9GAMM|nr:YbaL family putative K(+) efflux transporter [Luteimonas deserti]NYZ62363.1 Kef family K(+) transporter [Luteimonas deserti]